MRRRRLGKFNREALHRVIYSHLGKRRGRVLVGPKFGVDNSVQNLTGGKVLIATCDPLSYIPRLGPAASAWLSVNLLASDLTTSGLPPQYGIFDLNLPPEMNDTCFEAYWKAFHAECSKLGIAIVGGHTGRYEGCGYTVIGGGVLYAVGDKRSYLTSSMARSGDDLIVTKGAAIETTAVLTRVFPKTVKKALGAPLFNIARKALSNVSTVRDALTAVSVGLHEDGVTAMHDATEGGVISAIMELAYSSGLGAEVDPTNIPVSEETREICNLFHINPLTSLSEGSLIVACKARYTSKLLNRLHSARIKANRIGVLTSKTRGVYAISGNRKVPLKYPDHDPYWDAYWTAHRKHWS